MKKIKEFWVSLEEVISISKRELFLEITACTLAGIVIGIFFSPKKKMIIGSFNGNGHDLTQEAENELEKM